MNTAIPNSGKGSRRAIRRAVQIALAGTALASGFSEAALRDHGPISSVDHFPLWYRENAGDGGMALGQCTYPDDAGNGPLCLTSTADALPDRFAGNIGDEAFFATADVVIPLSGGELMWLGHLEMAYLTADGSPPAAWSPTNPQEVVFSRERIRIDLPQQDGACTGHYTIRTPFAVHEFDLVEGARALFYTDDKTPIPGDFTAALKGHTGPFLKWDVGQDGETPVSATNPAVTVTPPVGAPRKYIGDPNILHTFVGSTLPAGPGHEDKVFNNYVEITPPAGCDLGIGPGAPLFEENAAITGLIWDQTIQDPVTVKKATYTRNSTTAALDVWAEANSNQNIVLAASTDASQHLPSVTMQEETVAGAKTGRYHAHLEFDPSQTIPANVTVVNLTSNPASRASSAVVDAVVVTKSVYDPVSKKLCIAAHSGDETSPQPLSLNSPAYGAFGAPTAGCPGVSSHDVVLEKDLNTFAPDLRFPPEGVIVQSSLGGKETSQPVSLTGISDASLVGGAVADAFDNVKGSSTTQLDLTGPSSGAAPDLVKTTAGPDTTPPAFRIVVVGQPAVGTVTAPANGGTVTFAAEEGMETQDLTFFYAIQDTANNTVSNVARVDLSVDKVIPPPVGVYDAYGIFRTGGARTFKVLSNDVTGLSNTPIDVASVKLVAVDGVGTVSVDGKSMTTPRATIVANADGSITYTPVAQGGAAQNTVERFAYTVGNTAGSVSAPIPVSMVYRTAAELPGWIRVRPQWTVRANPSYANISVPGIATAVNPTTFATTTSTINLPQSATCRLTTNNNVVGEFGTIGSANWTGGSWTVLGSTPTPVGTWRVTCTNSNGNSFTSGQI